MKFIFDNDFIGPGGSAINAAFLCTTLPNEDLLGFTCVAGDDRVTVGARELLRFLKLIARDDIPVLIGADRPLLNTAARMARWQEDYGKLSWIGQWNSPLDPTQGDEFRALADHRIQEISDQHAALYMIDCANRHPGEVTIICGGPMTNVALAARLDPGFASKVHLVVSNGPTHNLDVAAGLVSAIEGFNFIFDPEAASICLSESFASVVSVGVVTPGSLMTEGLRDRFSGPAPLQHYLSDNAWIGLPMWDELTVALAIQPHLVTRVVEAWMAVDVNWGASRGRSVVFAEKFRPNAGETKVNLVLDYDRADFETFVVESIAKFA